MTSLAQRLRGGVWGLDRARDEARVIAADRHAVRTLVGAMFDEDVELRKRAADVARRITDRDPASLRDHADELMGLLAEVPIEESRTRWHLGLVVARVAHTWEQRMRAGRMMLLLATDESVVVRCSGVEGIGLLAMDEAGLREDAEEVVERALRDGSKAVKCRARVAKRLLEKAGRGGSGVAALRRTLV